MRTSFLKMHGAGNDFAVFDERGGSLGMTPRLAAAIADRHHGVGCDQVISIEPSARADAFMRIRNADGGEAEACGNATRCVAALLARENGARRIVIETVAGLLSAEIGDGGEVEIDMGRPSWQWDEIPLARPVETLRLPEEDGWPGGPAAVSMGNPHVTFFVADAEAVDAAGVGRAVEYDPLFPERVNVGFASLLGPDRLRLRVWERGAGLTQACGSGACAALVNAVRRGLAGRRAEMVMDGGTLAITWRRDGHVLMRGPTQVAFAGEVDLDSYRHWAYPR